MLVFLYLFGLQELFLEPKHDQWLYFCLLALVSNRHLLYI
ncbi:hypothetical protein ALO43_200504 [Pseudomonas tremae]|uniref:Uncharacterized protein n=1 Tax=Pseudomonas tremae TaxID=200454 RepID=A0AA40P4A8_9PSED|nr:hypothetical protein ALO43_200504 [Pseudomonas tremae]